MGFWQGRTIDQWRVAYRRSQGLGRPRVPAPAAQSAPAEQNDKLNILVLTTVVLFAVAVLLPGMQPMHASVTQKKERIYLSCVLALEEVGGVEIVLAATQHN